jgi:RNA polymerase sigma factor (sigma-70 family)
MTKHHAFDERFPSLYRYLDRLCGDDALAADVAQDAFIRLYRRGDMPEAVSSWLVSVAHNLLRDEHRRRSRRLRILRRWSDEPRSEVRRSPDVDLIADERRRTVRKVLDSMAERDRQILLLRHEGYGYREIAAALGFPASSIGTLLARAKREFRAAFEEEHGTP